MLRRLEHRIDEVEPYLVSLGEVTLVNVSVSDGLGPLTLPYIICQLLGYLFEAWALLELLLLFALPNLSEP